MSSRRRGVSALAAVHAAPRPIHRLAVRVPSTPSRGVSAQRRIHSALPALHSSPRRVPSTPGPVHDPAHRIPSAHRRVASTRSRVDSAHPRGVRAQARGVSALLRVVSAPRCNPATAYRTLRTSPSTVGARLRTLELDSSGLQRASTPARSRLPTPRFPLQPLGHGLQGFQPQPTVRDAGMHLTIPAINPRRLSDNTARCLDTHRTGVDTPQGAVEWPRRCA